MSIPIEVPGLDVILREIGEGKLVVVESGADAAKSFFVRRLSLSAGKIGWPVTFVTSRDKDELQAHFAVERGDSPLSDRWIDIREEDRVKDLDDLADGGGLLAMDSFSFLALDQPAEGIARSLRELRSICHHRGTSAVLATDRGMLDPRADAVVNHLADGLLQFHTRESPDGVQRYLRIPKWMDGKFVDRNIYYEFDGKRISVDLRNRVL